MSPRSSPIKDRESGGNRAYACPNFGIRSLPSVNEGHHVLALGYVDSTPYSFPCWHDKLSGIIWTPMQYVTLHFRDRCEWVNPKLSLSTKHLHFDSFLFDIVKFISPSKYSVSQPASQSASNLNVFSGRRLLRQSASPGFWFMVKRRVRTLSF